jgi:hypothetical protein
VDYTKYLSAAEESTLELSTTSNKEATSVLRSVTLQMVHTVDPRFRWEFLKFRLREEMIKFCKIRLKEKEKRA